jgi:3',5'-cyclic AMP phosphodiesterase CpdA
MKKLNLLAITLVFLALTISFNTVKKNQKVVHLCKNESATILIPDFKSGLKFMQITDSHISIKDERESDMWKYAERMQKAYDFPYRHFNLDIKKSTFEYLDDALQKAKDRNVELLILTGDIVNFPSPVSVSYVIDKLKKTGIPWLYISGNHDWNYEGMEGSLDFLRKTWIDKSLLPLYQGHNPLCYSEIIKGINFVGIDNSTGQVNKEQVEFLRNQLKHKNPIILFSHIPYDFIDKSDSPEMIAFIETISSNCDKILAILAGHTHQLAHYFTGNMCQYVSLPSFQGASFTVDVKPINP